MTLLTDFTSRANGDTSNWDVPLDALLADLYNRLAAAEAAVDALAGGTVTPFGSVVNVKDYGAIGDGVHDDTPNIILARNALTNNGATGEISKTLYFPSGKYRVTAAGCIIDSPDAGGAGQTILRSFEVLGDGKRRTEIMFDVGTTPSGHVGSQAPFIMGNRVNRLRVSKLRLSSTNFANTGFFFWSRDADDTPTLYPAYGTGNNQDIIFREVEWQGNWRWGVLLDGDAQTNLNSEFFLHNCAATNSTVFSSGLFQVGYTDWQNNSQQDQMLNYTFEDCKFEYKSGDCLVFNRGGHVNIRGGSWILGVGDDTAATGGVFFKTGVVTAGHNDSAMLAAFNGTRFELRNINCRMFDIGWYGAGAHLSFYDCSDSANSFKSFGPLLQAGTIRGRSGSYPSVRAQNCHLGGFWRVVGNWTSGGKIVLDQCGFKSWAAGGVGTATAANTFLRYDDAGTVPKYRYVDCPGVTDASN